MDSAEVPLRFSFSGAAHSFQVGVEACMSPPANKLSSFSVVATGKFTTDSAGRCSLSIYIGQ